jgi:hypothetical protein
LGRRPNFGWYEVSLIPNTSTYQPGMGKKKKKTKKRKKEKKKKKERKEKP